MKDKLMIVVLLAAVLVAVLAVILVNRRPAPPVVPVRPVAVERLVKPETPPVVVRPPIEDVPVAVAQPVEAPVAATPELPSSTSEPEYTDFDNLQWIHSKYVYESFTQLGSTRVGKMFNHESRQTFTINEGDELEPATGVMVESLDSEKAIVRLRDATDTMICTGNPRYAFLEEWRKNPQPPTPEEERLAFEVYMAQHGLRANLAARRAGRPPAPAWREPTEDELRDQMRHYLATTGKEAEEFQKDYIWTQPNPRLLTPEQIEKNRQAYYKAMGIPPDTKPIYRHEERYEPRVKKLGLEDEVENPPSAP